MLEKVKNCITNNNLLKENDTVIVGFSGGADSVALLFALKSLGYNVLALHVEHGIRGEEALQDALFSKNFCKANDITFYIEHINVPEFAKDNGFSLETAARIERHRIFNEYSKKFNCPIALAHNKNDQAETVLMHLLRGSGLNGLTGMKYSSNNVIRPLLDVSRDEIEVFNAKNNLSYVTDSTNLSNEYTRNKVRNKVIPLLNEVLGVNCVDNITECASILDEYNNYILSTTKDYEKQYIVINKNNVTLKIADVPYIIFIELIKRSLEIINGNIVDIEKVHLENVYELTNKESGKEIHLPYGIKAKRIYDQIVFTNSADDFEIQYDFISEKEFLWQDSKINSCFTTLVIKDCLCEHLDFDKLPESLTLRTRKSGDFIYLLGSKGKCTLKKYFIDKKIPQNLRNSIPLLAKDNEIYAIIGYTVSEKAKITDSTKKILKIYMEKE